MNHAPKLSLSARLATMLIAVVATVAVTHSIDGMSAHYVEQGAAVMAANATHHASQRA